MMMTMQGDEMKAIRDGLLMNQSEFAEALGMSRKAVNEMELGKSAIERRTELAVRYMKRRVDFATRLKIRTSDIVWSPEGDEWTAVIGPFAVRLTPQTRGRWSIGLRQIAPPHYAPQWPVWESGLEQAKAAAVLNAQHGLMDLDDVSPQ